MEWRRIGAEIILRLDLGEEVIGTLTAFLKDQGITSGSFRGIGALKETVLGFLDTRSQEYRKRMFAEEHELVALLGNFAMIDGEPFVHAHAVISDASFNCKGGHLFSAVIAVTGELHLMVSDIQVQRELDPQTGLKLIRFVD